jgi:hypothetical protein
MLNIKKSKIMELSKNDYVISSLDKTNSIITCKFLSKTRGMSDDAFKNEMEAFVKLVEEHKPKRELVDTLDMAYVITPEMQEWMNKTLFPRYVNILEKVAFLVSPNIFAQVSVEQTMKEETGQGFTARYFEDGNEAINWLSE